MIKIITGTSCIKLSEEVSKLLNIKLSKTEIIRFDNSETRVRVVDDVKESDVYVIQSASNPTDTNYMELFFAGDALKRSEAKKITAIIPYLGYARQNIQHRTGENISANVIVKFLEAVGFDEVILFDIHDEATLGIFSIPTVHLTGLGLLAEKVLSYVKNDVSDLVVATPDQSGVERARFFSQYLFKNKSDDIVVIEKKRDLDKLHQSKAVEIFGDVKNKTVILVDDIITSANTIINAADLAIKNGAKKVYAAAVHADFSPDAVSKIDSSKIEKLFTTNTITLKEETRSKKIEVISVAEIIAKEIKKRI